MVTVYTTPQDPRQQAWAQAIQSLGKSAADVVQQQRKAQVYQQVGQIENDPNVGDKWSAISKLGPEGIEAYGTLLRGKSLQSALEEHQLQLKNIQSEMATRSADILLRQKKERREEELMPLQQALVGARLKAAQTEQAIKGPEAGVAPEKTAQALQIQQAELREKQQKQQWQAEAGSVPIPKEVTGALTPEALADPGSVAAVESTYRENYAQGGPRGAAAAATRYAREQHLTTGSQIPMPEAAVTVAATTAQVADVVTRFRDTMLANPQDVGPFSNIRALFQKYQFEEPDVNFAALAEQQASAIQSAALSNKGAFISGTTVKMASDISPNINKTPIFNMKSMEMLVDKQLRTAIAQYNGMPSWTTGRAAFGKAIDSLQAVSNDLRTLTARPMRALGEPTSVRGPGGITVSMPPQETVVMYRGSMVDPVTLRPIVDRDQTYYDRAGNSQTGAQIIAKANDPRLNPSGYAPDIALRAFQQSKGRVQGGLDQDSGGVR